MNAKWDQKQAFARRSRRRDAIFTFVSIAAIHLALILLVLSAMH